jgi:hypothetical protein
VELLLVELIDLSAYVCELCLTGVVLCLGGQGFELI